MAGSHQNQKELYKALQALIDNKLCCQLIKGLKKHFNDATRCSSEKQ
jgi:hypothetical protein